MSLQMLSGDVRRGILCRYQGESDAIPERVEAFQEASLKVLHSLRIALDSPELPILQVAIACNSPKTPLADEINSLQQRMDLPMLTTVDAAGLELQQDGVHLTTAAQAELAQRLFTAYQQLITTTPS